jgi:hypothetical protein
MFVTQASESTEENKKKKKKKEMKYPTLAFLNV